MTTEEQIEQDEPTKKRRFLKYFLILLGIIILVVGLLIAGVYLFSPSKYNILVIGSDQRDPLHPTDVSVGVGRSDVLMIVSIPKNKKDDFSILMIPRDTYIEDEEFGMQKINHLYALGGRYESETLGSMPDTKRAVEELLDEKMDATFEVTFQGFEDIVEILGGVDTEAYGHLEPAEAVETVHNRYNKDGGDFGRAAAQREILRNLITRAKSYENATLIWEYLQEEDQARLTFSKTKVFCFVFSFVLGHFPDFSLGEMQEAELPGAGGRIYTPDFGKELYYWIPDEEAIPDVVDEYLN